MNNFFSLLVVSVLLFTGCIKEPSDNGMGRITGPVFDFSTTTDYNLSFGWDVPTGYKVAFSVFTVYPFDDQGRLKESVTAIEKAFTNDKGAYSKTITIPTSVEKIYIYTTYAGVGSRLLVSKVENGRLTTPVAAGINGDKEFELPSAAQSAGMNSRAAFTYNTNEVNNSKFNIPGRQTIMLSKYHTAKEGPNVTQLLGGNGIVKLHGRPVEMSRVNKSMFGDDGVAKDALTIDVNVLKTINAVLKGDGSGVPVDPKFLQSGDIKVTKEAELDLVFIQNWGAYKNVIAYYCYPTNNPPVSIGDIKHQVVAIPNAMERKQDYALSDTYGVMSMAKGEGVRLKYIDANGVKHDKFPAGTSVGWILFRDGYQKKFSMDFGLEPHVNAGLGANYSSPAFATVPNTAVLRYGDFVAVCFDDGPSELGYYRDYLDVVFNVQASPSDAIIDGVEDVDPEAPELPAEKVTVTGMGVLMYEDLWPFQGDFDMNDVVVKYVYEVTKNKDNAVTDAKVDFTFLFSGAAYKDMFAYYDPNVSLAEVTFNEGTPNVPSIERNRNIVRLSRDIVDFANKAEKVTYTVKYKFNNPIPIASYVMPPFDPFISIGNVTITGIIVPENGISKEVHLTNYPPTAVANMKWFQKKAHDFSVPKQGIYYVTYENYAVKIGEDLGQQLPFAVKIVFDKKEDLDGFKVTQETKHINKHYPNFKKWVSSGGKDNADWYLNFIANP